MKPDTAGQRIRDHGFKRILFTDIPACPGAEPDFGTARVLAQSARIPLFMGGSIQTRDAPEGWPRRFPGCRGSPWTRFRSLEDPDLLGSLDLAHI